MKIHDRAGVILADYPKAKSYGEVLEKGVEDGVSFKGANLEGMDLSGICLKGANFTGAVMTDVIFDKKTNLHNVEGNGKEVITIKTDVYTIVLTKDNVQISSKRCSVEELLSGKNVEMDYFLMDFPNLRDINWWAKWRPKLIEIIEKG